MIHSGQHWHISQNSLLVSRGKQSKQWTNPSPAACRAIPPLLSTATPRPQPQERRGGTKILFCYLCECPARCNSASWMNWNASWPGRSVAFWRQGACCWQCVSLRRCRGRSAAHAVSLRAHRCRCRSLRRRAAHPLPPGQGHCRAALKSAVNTHESGAGGKGFPLLQSLRDVLKHFSKEAVFLGGLWGCWLWDPIPVGGFGSGFSSSRWRQLWTGERALAERVALRRGGGMWLCKTAVYKNVLLKILENKGQFTDSAEIYIYILSFWQRPG